MTKQTTKQNLATAVGAALVGSLMLGTSVQAAENPFGITELNGGYMQIAMNEGKCGGAKKSGEGKCGEAKCGGDKKSAEGKCGGSEKSGEGKCGEAKCGGDKKKAEGKCGEAKCGGSK